MPVPLALVRFLPFEAEAAGNAVQIDASGTDTLTFEAAPDGNPALPESAIAVDATTATTTVTFTAGSASTSSTIGARPPPVATRWRSRC